MTPTTVMVLMGTRPEGIKLAPVIRELSRHPADFRPVVVSSAQHREMLDEVLRLFGIVPDEDLRVMEEDQDLYHIASTLLTRLKAVLARYDPGVVLVQGDTSTTAVGALAGFYHRALVGHVEAGLRTGDKANPFPEEVNRRLTGVLADLHFVASPQARENLLREGVPKEAIHLTGNTVVDALQAVRALGPDPAVADGLPVLDPSRKLLLVTAHRRESFGRPLRGICRALVRLVNTHDDVEVLYPTHPNPNVQAAVTGVLHGVPRIYCVAPLDYRTFVHVMDRASLILTDSGGIQEEAPYLGTPVLVLREKTERPEVLELGAASLVGTDPDRIVTEASRLLT
ncbi:MAG: non-hydrolyzing UDP-N-acetylglucosamine 2-epimerase, partial [Nitrospinota bacterium]